MRLRQPPERLVQIQVLQEQRQHGVEEQCALVEEFALAQRQVGPDLVGLWWLALQQISACCTRLCWAI
jgi:hypothetical protein